VLDAWDKIEYRYNHKDELAGLRTGFDSLDTLLNGLNRSDLIILAARPAMGKTALALNIAQNVAIKEQVPICIFSLEMSAEQLVERMMACDSSISLGKLKTGQFDNQEATRFATSSNCSGVRDWAPSHKAF
jgi:replicative DNA helicase